MRLVAVGKKLSSSPDFTEDTMVSSGHHPNSGAWQTDNWRCRHYTHICVCVYVIFLSMWWSLSTLWPHQEKPFMSSTVWLLALPVCVCVCGCMRAHACAYINTHLHEHGCASAYSSTQLCKLCMQGYADLSVYQYIINTAAVYSQASNNVVWCHECAVDEHQLSPTGLVTVRLIYPA